MLSDKDTRVKIEGILSEVDIKPSSFMKNGVQTDSIGGTIKVLVNQKINGVDCDLEIPVHMFASKFTNAGSPNPAYESINKIANEFVSIAASNKDAATRVRITNAKLTMNEYYGRNGQLISFPRVTTSFVNAIRSDECKPEASFNIVFMVASVANEVDKEGIETGRIKVVGMVPQYGGKVDVMTFYAASPKAIDGISNYWNEGDTVKAAGKLNFSFKTETVVDDSGFGEPTEEVHTVSISELIITGGLPTPMEGDFAMDENEVKAALRDREARLAQLKDKAASQGSTGKAPGKVGGKFSGLGF